MLAEYGTMSLKEVLAPAMEMAKGYPMEAELVHTIEKYQDRLKQWPSPGAYPAASGHSR